MNTRRGLLTLVVLACAAVLIGPHAAADRAPARRRPANAIRVAGRDVLIPQRRLEQMRATINRRAAARRGWLATAGARAQRLASRTAYRHLSATQAERVSLSTFKAFFTGLEASPATSVAAQGRILRYLNNDTAVVRSPSGQRLLERSSTPLRTVGGPVDLTLRAMSQGFSPVRAPEHVSIARHLNGGVSVGPARFTFAGRDVTGAVAAKSVVYANADADTDASTTPTASGIDLSVILRSPASPRTLRYHAELPGNLRLASTGTDAAAIVRGSRQVLDILPPTAHDAQGTPIPVQMHVARGGTLVLQVARTTDVAYPILVDPQITVPTEAPGWYFDGHAYCHNDPPGDPFLAPRPGEIDAPYTDGYQYNQCPSWTWTSASSGLGHMTRLEIDDVNWTPPPQDDMGWTVEPVEADGDYTHWDCSDDATVVSNHDAWSGNEVWSGTDCGTELLEMLEVFANGTQGPASLSIGSVLVTAPYLPLPSSPERLGGANPGEPDIIHSCSGFPVDCASGNMFETDTDLGVRGHGPALQAARTYNAQAAVTQAAPGALGYGWSGMYGDHLLIDMTAGTVTVVQGNGSEVPYDGTAGTLAPQGSWVQATLTANDDGTYTYTLPDQETEHFDSTGRLSSQSDRYGNTITCAYDDAGSLASVTDDADRQITLQHNPDGTISQVTGPMGTVSYTYDADGNLTQVTGLNGGVWSYGYDATHRMTSETDPLGHTITTGYDSDNRVTDQTDGAGRTRHWSYTGDPSSGASSTTITNPGGDVTYEEFNGAGEPTLITRGYGTAAARTQKSAYDASYELQYLTDGNGHQWAYTYDSSGNRTSTTDPLGNTTYEGYDAGHDVTYVSNPLGDTTNYNYSAGELTSTTQRISETGQTRATQYGYNAHGDLTSVTDPRNMQTTFGYDSAGDVTSMTSPSGDQTTWTYDASGYPIGMTRPARNTPGGTPADYTTTYTNDATGQPTAITDPLGHTTRLAYDQDGNLAAETDASGNRTTYTYNGDNEITRLRRPDGTALRTTFNDDGQITAQTNGTSDPTTYGYDAAGDETTSTDPLHRETDYSYDGAGNVATVTDPAGRITTYGYDEANQLTSITYSDASTPNVTYAYNADGQRTSMTDGSGTSTYGYDSIGRLTDVTNGAGDHTGYGYDLADNITSITYPNAEQITRTFDDSERLASVSDWLGNTISFAYDPDSNLQSDTLPAPTREVDRYTYDHADQLASSTAAQASTTLASSAYTFTAGGQVASTTESGLPEPAATTHAYSYDEADRLTQSDGGTGYTYDAAGQLTGSAAGTYTYNQLGERTQFNPTSGTATQYAYDQAGRLITYTPADGDPTTYAYDGDGLRMSSTTGADTTSFAWDQSGTLPLLLTDGHNSYVYGPEELPVEQISSSGGVEYLHHDRVGSTRLITDASGGVAGAYTYAPYGAVAEHTGDATSPLQYAGQYTDATSGLQYLHARYYDPSTGQLLSRDPAEAQTREPYSYALDDPTDNVDPSGISPLGPTTLSAGPVAGGLPEIQAPPVVVPPLPVPSRGSVTATPRAGAQAQPPDECNEALDGKIWIDQRTGEIYICRYDPDLGAWIWDSYGKIQFPPRSQSSCGGLVA